MATVELSQNQAKFQSKWSPFGSTTLDGDVPTIGVPDLQDIFSMIQLNPGMGSSIVTLNKRFVGGTPCLSKQGLDMGKIREDVNIIRQDIRRLFYGRLIIYDPSVDKIKEVKHGIDISKRKPITKQSRARDGKDQLPTPDEIAGSLSDSRLVKKSRGPSQASRPSKKRKLQKRASEAGSSAPELDRVEGMDEADLADLCVEIEDSLERDEGMDKSKNHKKTVKVEQPRTRESEEYKAEAKSQVL
ncbi:hypothetical protein Tco_0493573 [Tanacetum coccineum]